MVCAISARHTVWKLLKLLLHLLRNWPCVGRPFATTEFKRIFNAYADNIYYSSGSEEANAYLLGGATPSTRQTTQYLLRNEVRSRMANDMHAMQPPTRSVACRGMSVRK